MNFNEKAKNWDADPDRTARAIAFAHEIQRTIAGLKIKNALEFGSGTGNVSFQMTGKFESITLADTSEGMLEVLKEKIKAGNISNMKPYLINESNPISSLRGFDIIYTLLTLHHIKDLNRVFYEFSLSLNKGGVLFIGDLVTEDGSFHHKDPEFDGYKGFETSWLKNLMIGNGLELVNEKIFYTIKREYNSVLREYPMFILTGKKL